MPQFLGFILLIGLAIFAVKLAILFLLVAGLIFKTKETIGLITILAVFAGFNAHPGIGIGLIVLVLLISLYFKGKEINASKPDD